MAQAYHTVHDVVDRAQEVLGTAWSTPSIVQALIGQIAVLNPLWTAHDRHIRRAQEAIEQSILQCPPIVGQNLQMMFAFLQVEGYKIGLTSNTSFISGYQLRQVLTNQGIDPAFMAFTLFSDELSVAKPNPRIFELITRATGVHPREILHVGDNRLTDIHGARIVGLNTQYVASPDDTCEAVFQYLASKKEMVNVFPA